LAAVIAAGALGGCGQAQNQTPSEAELTPIPSGPSLAPDAPKTPDVPESVVLDAGLYVRNVADDYIVKLGDAKTDIEPALAAKGDIDMAYVIEFVEEFVERWRYQGNEGISINYDLNNENKVCAIRISTDEWELPNGLRVGMNQAAVASMYDKDMIFKFNETEDLWLGFDENLNPVPFEYEPPVPFLICFCFEDGRSCDTIVVQDNRPVGSIF
jgi:hypothetical protein